MITRTTVRALIVGAAGVLALATLSSSFATSSSAVDCYPPGSCVVDTPAYDLAVAELGVGTAAAQTCDDSGCTSVPVTKTTETKAILLTIGDATLRITPLTGAGTPRQVTASGDLVITTAAGVKITLSGLQPGSWVDIYLNSNRILLGKMQVAADGTVNSTVPLPAGTSAGVHTLQIAATTMDGTIVSAALGMYVAPLKLSATAARYQFVAGKPGTVGSKSVRRGKAFPITATLADALTGVRVSAAKAKSLGRCTATATVKSAAGKTLLKAACMTYNAKSGKPYVNWVVSPNYLGKAKVTFTFTESGRKASIRTQTFTIIK